MGDETAFRLFADGLVAGENDAAHELLGRYSAQLVSLAGRQMSPRLQAKVAPEDVLQSVFRTLFRRLEAGEFELRGWGALWGFLSLMTLRKVQQAARRYGAVSRDCSREVSLQIGDRHPWEITIPDRTPTADETAAFADELRAFFCGLADQDRRTIELILAGEEPVDIARQLGCSQRTVRRTLARMRERLIQRQLRFERE